MSFCSGELKIAAYCTGMFAYNVHYINRPMQYMATFMAVKNLLKFFIVSAQNILWVPLEPPPFGSNEYS